MNQGWRKKLVLLLVVPPLFLFAAGVIGVLLDPFTGGALTDGSIDGDPNTLGWRGLIVGLVILTGLVLIVFGVRTNQQVIRKSLFLTSIVVVLVGSVSTFQLVPVKLNTSTVPSTSVSVTSTTLGGDSISPAGEDWTDLTGNEYLQDSVEFWPRDKYMISAPILNNSGSPVHYRFRLDIDVDGGISRRAAFCTTTPAATKPGYQVVNLKVFRGDDGGESWAGLLDLTSDISFSFSWSIYSAEKSTRWCGAH